MIPIIKNRGYNNDSGVNYKNCGLSQYTPNEYKQVNAPDTAEFENEQRDKFLEKTMNDGGTDNVATLSAKDKAVERQLIIKEDPNLGTGDQRITKIEKNAVRLQNDVSKTNFKANEMLNTNIPLNSG